MKIKRFMNAFSIRGKIIFIFVFITVITITTLGVVIFSSWVNSAHEITAALSKKTNEEINMQISHFFDNPLEQNQFNKNLIGNDFINMLDQEERERFFILSLRQYHEQVYSLGYGTVTGEYYGARRLDDVVEIMRNDSSTGGYSWYYSINDDLTANEMVVEAGLFDARIRPWYIEAVNEGDSSFSPVYKHFIIEDLAVSLAIPIYNQDGLLQGVLGAHMILSNINEFLSETLIDSNGSGIIIDANTNELIANSMGDANYLLLDDDSVQRLTIDELSNQSFGDAYQTYSDDESNSFYLNNDPTNNYYTISEIHVDGLNWIVITSISKGILFSNIINNIIWMAVISIISVIFMIVIFRIFLTKFLKPIDELVEVSHQYEKGDFSNKATVYGDNELGILAKAYNTMSESISNFVNGLEQLVDERTKNLQVANETLKESEQRFKILHNASFGGIAIHDKGYILDCNQGLSDITGYSMDELINMDGLLLIAPDDRELVREKIRLGNEKPYEAFGIRKNGDIYPLKIEAKNIPYNGKKVRVVEFRDITEKRNSELDLIKSKEKLEIILDNLPIGIAVNSVNPNVKFDYMNDNFPKIYGVSKKDLEKEGNFWEAVYEDENFRKAIQKEVMEDISSNDIKRMTWNEIPITKKGGKTRYVNAYAMPLPESNLLVSSVMDITERKLKEQEIIHVSNHDYLTAIPNRRYYQEQLLKYDKSPYYPLGLINMDVNGLKLINDAFGHNAGNLALKKIANTLYKTKRTEDFHARIGGDEFALICPNIEIDEMEKLIDSIEKKISKQKVNDIELSLAMGYAIKMNEHESTRTVLTKAENNMYKNKVVTGHSIRNDAIQSILQTLQHKFIEEKVHSERVSQFCKLIAEAMDLRKDEIKELEMAGLFHDIGKISIPDAILYKPGKLTEKEWKVMKNHTINGYQILRAADQYSNIAEYAMSHHERIDGKGYPNGIKGEDIPLFAKIICIADSYEAMTSDRPYRKALKKDAAIKELRDHSGTQFDSDIVDIFIQKVINDH